MDEKVITNKNGYAMQAITIQEMGLLNPILTRGRHGQRMN